MGTMDTESYMAQYDDIKAASQRISEFVHRTPVFTSSYLDKRVGRQVYFKCENFQKTGAFKVRGALNALLKMKEDGRLPKGVTTESSGNHAMALAYAAKKSGTACIVVTPNDTPVSKQNAMRGYGAEVHLSEPTMESRIKTVEDIVAKTEYMWLSSHENHDLIAGQGTVGLEFNEQVPDLDAIFISACGGGLACGVAVATKYMRPNCKVYVVEPLGKELAAHLESGKRDWPDKGNIKTIADGLRVLDIGTLNWPYFLKYIEKDVFTVNDEEISKAMKTVFTSMKLVIEPSAGATVAAVLSDHMKKLGPEIKKVGVVLCGGNVDVDHLPWT